MGKKYNISLDIGTTSVGWAVTDRENGLCKFKSKNMWGVRLFEEASTAEERRVARSSRRRLKRRKQRIFLLQTLVGQEIEKLDPYFFLKLKESGYTQYDRSIHTKKYNLFNEIGITDKTYYKLYPTIYHLRTALIEQDKKFDIRLIYLALHHLIKYRGNFIHEGQRFDKLEDNFEELLKKLFDNIKKRQGDLFTVDIKQLATILKDHSIKGKVKYEKAIALFTNIKNKPQLTHLLNAIIGLTCDTSKLFQDIECEEIIKFKFSDDNIEQHKDKLEQILGEEFEYLEVLERLYQTQTLEFIRKGYTYICQGKVEGYQKFKSELNDLKKILKDIDYETYEKVFKVDKNLYDLYIKAPLATTGKATHTDQLYKEIKKGLAKNTNPEYREVINYLLLEIDKGCLLEKQTTVDNGYIPYQLHLKELECILENQGKYHPVLKEEKDKIIKLLTFKIPYYVGPLNKHSPFSWIVKKEEKIYPWNFDDVVERDATAERFITRMTNKCTYLRDQDVLPKHSLLYTDYMFYNEINKIKIDNIPLDENSKELLFEEILVRQVKTVSEKMIQKWAEKNQLSRQDGKYQISGLQGERKMSATLTPYIDLISILGSRQRVDKHREDLEQIIKWLTIFEDRDIAKKKIEETYTFLKEEQIQKILKLKYKGWGKLSKKLLKGIRISYGMLGDAHAIKLLKRTNLNLQQILTNTSFKKEIERYQENLLAEKMREERRDYKEIVKELPGSPAIKRGIIQSIKIVEEIKKVMGSSPENIFIEFAREDQDSKRTQTRKHKLEKLYRNIEGCEEIKQLLSEEKGNLAEDKLYLWYLQQGKCMYTGETLSQRDLRENCEIDHILYQSLVKDDSIENRVLVKKSANQKRSNFRMPGAFATEQAKILWTVFYNQGLIGSKKYNNLRLIDLDEKREEGFIERQLVETRQITKYVTQLLVEMSKGTPTQVIAIKSGLVSDFRKKFDIPKIREVNDYHHAQDALITGFIGNFIQRRFPTLENEFIYNVYKQYRKESIKNKKRRSRFSFILEYITQDYIDEQGEVIWDTRKYLSRIKQQVYYKDCFITKMVIQNRGQLFDLTIKPKDKPANFEKKIPIKKGKSVIDYGYYTGGTEGYSIVIYYEKGQKGKKELVSIPMRYTQETKGDQAKLLKYLESQGYKDASIISHPIYKYQLVKNSSGIFYMASSSEWHNAKQLLIGKEYSQMLKKLGEIPLEEKEIFLINFYEYMIGKIEEHYTIFIGVKNKLESMRDNFIALSNKDKEKIVYEVLKVTKCSAINGDFKVMKGTNQQGRLNSKKLNIEDTEFIYQSVTGLFEKRVRY